MYWVRMNYLPGLALYDSTKRLVRSVVEYLNVAPWDYRQPSALDLTNVLALVC